MHRRQMLKAMAGLALCPICTPSGFAAEGVHWGYEGPHGPATWGDIDAASKVCSIGSQQSPIDVTESIVAALPQIQVNWTKRASTIVNNGHTIQINFAEGNTLTLGKERYALLQFHFHRPSEHLVGGKSYPMEVHFVHRNAAGNLAVIGVLMTIGKANPIFSKIVQTMPAKEGEAPADAAINPNNLLPAQRSYYRYSGSLTTPPCSEVVDWHLLTTAVSVADADVAAFAKLYPMNARPILKSNRRFVLRSG